MKPVNCTKLNHEDDDKHEEIKWFINVEIYSLWKKWNCWSALFSYKKARHFFCKFYRYWLSVVGICQVETKLFFSVLSDTLEDLERSEGATLLHRRERWLHRFQIISDFRQIFCHEWPWFCSWTSFYYTNEEDDIKAGLEKWSLSGQYRRKF